MDMAPLSKTVCRRRVRAMKVLVRYGSVWKYDWCETDLEEGFFVTWYSDGALLSRSRSLVGVIKMLLGKKRSCES